ncbi:MAG: fluoride exporter [Actinomycetota bacterium]|nr:fluoride exporter [Actinomycetota bacterium]
MSVLAWVGFLVAGALGATARALVGGWAQDRTAGGLPWGTFGVNVSGSLVAGLVSGAVSHHGLSAVPATVLATGFCGAYTTFSAFTFETVRLLEEGSVGRALLNSTGTLAVGLLAAAAGVGLASR